jgi:hypothetical protein
MTNDHLSEKEAKEYIDQRMKEVESLCTDKQLGYSDHQITRWILLTILVIALALELIL